MSVWASLGLAGSRWQLLRLSRPTDHTYLLYGKSELHFVLF